MDFLEKHFHLGGVHQLRTKCPTSPRHDKVRLQCTVHGKWQRPYPQQIYEFQNHHLMRAQYVSWVQFYVPYSHSWERNWALTCCACQPRESEITQVRHRYAGTNPSSALGQEHPLVSFRGWVWRKSWVIVTDSSIRHILNLIWRDITYRGFRNCEPPVETLAQGAAAGLGSTEGWGGAFHTKPLRGHGDLGLSSHHGFYQLSGKIIANRWAASQLFNFPLG